MKWLIIFATAFTICFSMSLAAAQNKVVVIPLASAKKLENVVTVSHSGGNSVDPVAAVNSIADATADNPYLVAIGPGVYNLTTTLKMKEYVSIAGAGEQATRLSGEISTAVESEGSALVSGASNSSISDLTVENTGSKAFAIAIYNYNTSPTITNVTAISSGGMTANSAISNKFSSPVMSNITAMASGGVYNFAVENQNSSPIMTNVRASATTSSGGTDSYGVCNYSSSSPIMTNVTASASGGAFARGVFNYISSSPKMSNVTATANFGDMNYGVHNQNNSSPTMNNIIATASGGTDSNYGVHNDNNSSPAMTNVIATASGGPDSIGVFNNSSSPFLRHCTIEGTTHGILVEGGGTTRVMQSSIIGVATINGAILSCVTSDNGVNTALDATCN